MPLFTADSGRSTRASGGGCCGDFIILALPFLLISGEALLSWEFTLCHSLTQLCTGFAASMTALREMYSSWLLVKNSKSSIFCSASK